MKHVALLLVALAILAFGLFADSDSLIKLYVGASVVACALLVLAFVYMLASDAFNSVIRLVKGN